MGWLDPSPALWTPTLAFPTGDGSYGMYSNISTTALRVTKTPVPVFPSNQKYRKCNALMPSFIPQYNDSNYGPYISLARAL